MTKRLSWTLVFATLLSLAVLLAGTSKINATDQPATGSEVKIDNFSFAPETLTVPAGTEVTWVNRDDIPHTIVSTDGVFKSKVRDTDEKFSFKFTKSGTYSYYCSIHPKMTGKIVVQ